VNAGGTLYAIGGTPWANGGDQDGAVHRWVGGAWVTAAPLSGAGPVLGGAAGVDNLGRIVIYGGYVLGDDENAGPEATYDPVEGPQGGVASRPAPSSAVGFTAFARDAQGRLYGLGGGLGEANPSSGYCDRYDGAANAWEVLPPMPTPAADACAAYDGAGHVLVFGGIDASGSARLANVAQYDVASNTWSDSAVPDLPVALSGASAVLGADGRVYVIGGEAGPVGAGVTQSTTYKLDLADNAWTVAPSLATPRKRFAGVLGDDDCIYAIGGDNDAGGTNLVERIFTPRCPSITSQPLDQAAWRGTVGGFAVTVNGATPLAFQWRKDGVVLSDGPTFGGSVLSGTTSRTLTIHAPVEADAGAYDVVVTNDCGGTISDPAVLTLRSPPVEPEAWEVIELHPAWATEGSAASGIARGVIGGSGTWPTPLGDGRTMTLSHPVVWDAGSFAPADITPAGSVGGAVLDAEGDLFTGWFWHTYSCYSGGQWWTCAWQSAGFWAAPSLAFDEVHMSGAEYDAVSGTDGERMVGTVTYEYSQGNYSSYAYLWGPPTFGGQSLHPASGASNSGASAIDGGRQYGSYNTPYPGPVTHAAMWSGIAASMVDIHPAGFSRSWVSGAGDDQAVGSAYLGDVPHAALWAGAGAAFLDLHPPGAASSSAVAAHGGVQIGSVGGRAAMWFGTPESHVDLGAYIPPEFTSCSVADVEVDAAGVITVVGSGYNAASGRSEALLWRSVSACPGDLDHDGGVGLGDLSILLAHYGVGGGAARDDGDMDGDGDVDLADLAALLGRFGVAC